jgi:hypothetical protein
MPHADMHARFRPGYIARFLSAALLLSGAALADDAGLARCRAITDAAARLACYDALPPGETRSAPAGAGQAQPQPQPAAKPPPAATFGLEERVPPKDMLDQIDSQIQGKFEGWLPNSFFKLANGQVWQVADGSTRYYDLESPKVQIRRGVLGAFYLNLDGDNRTVRVRRVQ